MDDFQEDSYGKVSKIIDKIASDSLVFKYTEEYKKSPVVVNIVVESDGFHVSAVKNLDNCSKVIPGSECFIKKDLCDELIINIKEIASKYIDKSLMSHIIFGEGRSTEGQASSNILCNEMKDKIKKELNQGFKISYNTFSILNEPDCDVKITSLDEPDIICAVKVRIEGEDYYFMLDKSDFLYDEILGNIILNVFMLRHRHSVKNEFMEFLQRKRDFIKMHQDIVLFVSALRPKEHKYISTLAVEKQSELEKHFISLNNTLNEEEKEVIMLAMYFYKKTPAFKADVERFAADKVSKIYDLIKRIHNSSEHGNHILQNLSEEEIIAHLFKAPHNNFQQDLIWFMLLKDSLTKPISAFFSIIESLIAFGQKSDTPYFSDICLKLNQYKVKTPLEVEAANKEDSVTETQLMADLPTESTQSIIKSITESDAYKSYSVIYPLKECVIFFNDIIKHNMLNIISEMFGLDYKHKDFLCLYKKDIVREYLYKYKTNDTKEVINKRRSSFKKAKMVEDVLSDESDISLEEKEKLKQVAACYGIHNSNAKTVNPAVPK